MGRFELGGIEPSRARPVSVDERRPRYPTVAFDCPTTDVLAGYGKRRRSLFLGFYANADGLAPAPTRQPGAAGRLTSRPRSSYSTTQDARQETSWRTWNDAQIAESLLS